MKEQVKELWQRCFDDSEAFVEMYFRLRYNDRINEPWIENGKLVAALQTIPYPMTYLGETVNTAYVSGACTHPDYRGRGIMKKLLLQAFTSMLQQGITFSTLIPAEPWLFDYYAKMGYRTLFRQSQEKYTKPQTALPASVPELRTLHHPMEIFNFFDRKMREQESALLHTFADCRVIMADLRISNGRLFTLKQNEAIVAGAIVMPQPDGNWLVAECLADTPEWKEWLLHRICEELAVSDLELILPGTGAPLGMLRIVHAEAALDLYARTHPEALMSIQLTDSCIEENNGLFLIQGGRCKKSAEPSLMDDSTLRFDIGTLAEWLFKGLHPYMCLMLN